MDPYPSFLIGLLHEKTSLKDFNKICVLILLCLYMFKNIQ